jgi:hypothetical protein
MASYTIGQVIETGDLSYNINPKSEEDRILPLGTIKVRVITDTDVENLTDIYARPLSLNFSLMPLNGEQVILINGPSIEGIGPKNKNVAFYYLPFPINSTDDSVINQINNLTQRTTNSKGGTLIAENPFKPGKTFPFPCRPLPPLQPFEGELIMQNRSGASIRLGTGTSNNSQYYKKPQHHKDTKKGDPTFAMTLERPGGPKPRPINEIPVPASGNKSQSDKDKSQKYRIENLSNNLTGIFAGISQKYTKVKLGRGRRIETKGVPRFNKPQILLDTSRIVLNAKKDNIFIIAKNKVVLEGRKFFIATDEHNVDFDELVNRVQELAKELHRLTSAQAFYSTPFGPTGPASNLAQVLRIHILCQKFQLLPPNLFASAPEPNTDIYDFGVNSVKGNAITRKLLGSGGGGGAIAGGGQGNTNLGVEGNSNLTSNTGTGNGNNPEVQIRRDFISLINSLSSKDIELGFNPELDITDAVNASCGLPQSQLGYQVDSNGNPIIQDGDGLTFKPIIPEIEPEGTLEPTFEDVKLIDFDDSCKGVVYNFSADLFSGLTGSVKRVNHRLALVLGEKDSCAGWYIMDSKDGDSFILDNSTKITSNILADNDCISDNILSNRCLPDDSFRNVRLILLNSLLKFN